jgi:hypothetical protein
MPILDSLTAGYIIPLWTEILVKKTAEDIAFMPSNSKVFFQMHPKSQNPHYPNVDNDYAYIKFVNPWAIITPKGYSCLFTTPFHNSNPWVKILDGIVDTDRYHEVNFPAILTKTDSESILPAGMPFVQVIPFKREKWKAEYGNEKTTEVMLKSYSKRKSYFNGAYKHFFWSRKSFD